MKVSVITPSFNQGKFIEKTIRSVLCQDYPDIEYIVVDGLSRDNTRYILDRYKDDIDHIIIEADEGQSDALNKGFEMATGDILAYLNSDDVYANQNVISTVVRYFQENDVDVIYGLRYLVSEEGNFVNVYPYRSFDQDIFVWCDYIPQECTFWTRSIFEKSGAFISQDFDFAMDYELWFRFLEHGARFLSVEEPFGLFRYYANQKSIAQWQQKGLPEIARLHEKYNGAKIPEHIMHGYFWEYTYGTNPAHELPQYNTYHGLWRTFIEFKTKLLENTPIDEWVYHQPLRDKIHPTGDR
jgi:glycosyltransferase involved in cell wall biosynthesis